MARTHSSVSTMGMMEKIRQAAMFFSWRFSGDRNPKQYDAFLDGLEMQAAMYEQLTGRSFQDARVFEIGYGARPMRLFSLMSMGIDVYGIDLDEPLYRFSVTGLYRILKKNGFERALKSAVRNIFFDKKEQSTLAAALKLRGHEWRIDPARLLIGDATTYDYSRQKFDFIHSDDVFEHIPPADLERLVAALVNAITPHGILSITPFVFTGISGNHLPEWFPYIVDKDMPRKTEPWEHLRQQRTIGNVYLNKLSRAQYREIFSRHFEIVEETVVRPNLGRRWLTPEVRQELAQWSEDELFSNRVRFVLRAKH